MYATDNTTVVNGIGLAFGLLMSVLVLVLPRRCALVPVITTMCFMTMGQRVIVLGLNFTVFRILLLFGLLRVTIRDEARVGKLGAIDGLLILWVVSSITTYTILWGTLEAFVNRMGLAYDALGWFFLFRILLRDADDVRRGVKQLALLVVPLAASMMVEKLTGQNAFSLFGGVPPETIVRDGVLRCQGPFSHPILAGTFGSAVLPLFLGLWWGQRGASRLMGSLGIIASVTITVAAGSSGPVGAGVLGIVGLFFWPARRYMRAVRWGVALALLGLHLLMKAPVWFLLARVSVFTGSTGYHRAILIDHAVKNFWQWWLVGTYSTSEWGYYMFDVTNQYVLVGVQGGVITLGLFVAIIARCFGAVGRGVKVLGGVSPGEQGLSKGEQRVVWSLGAALLVHVINYFSVPYFDQNIVNWYLLLAMIAVTSRSVGKSVRHDMQSVPNVVEVVRGWNAALVSAERLDIQVAERTAAGLSSV